MTVPLIGVTTYRLDTRYGFPAHAVAEKYVEALSEAGAAPILIPLRLPEERLDAILRKLDGLLFTGGGDIHPSRFGAQMDELVGAVDEDRDRIELHLFRQILPRSLPFLGICRGFQLVNVGLGGDLYTDILAQHPGARHHDYFPDWPRDHLAHDVEIRSGSGLAKILGVSKVEVNSLHHQGLRRLAPRLEATAFSPDGIVEAVELPGYPFGLAVQWHPEWLQAYPEMRNLFRAFVQACGQPKV